MEPGGRLRQFFLPSLTRRYLLRVFFVALASFLFFSYACIPFRIQGASMEPAYPNGGFNFCWTPRYLLSKPRRGDVVAVRFAGHRVMLLKRIVGLEGEQLEFRNGSLFINGRPLEEPYIVYPCNWNLPPRRVETGSVYVIGDNRSMPIENHYFGQASLKRIVGRVLW